MAGGGMSAGPQQGPQGASQPTGFGSMRGYRPPFSGGGGYDGGFGGYDWGQFRGSNPVLEQRYAAQTAAQPLAQPQLPSEVTAGGSVSRPTGMTPPSGYRPMSDAPQFYQPVYQPQYTNYQSPFGGYGGFGGYGSPFGGFGGYGGYGSQFGGFDRGIDNRGSLSEVRGFGGGYGSPFGGFGGMRAPMMRGIGALWSQPQMRYEPLNFNPPTTQNMIVPQGPVNDGSQTAAKGGIMKLLKK